ADDSASGYRGAAGVHDDLHPVALRPPHHRLGLLGVFHAGDADLAHDADTGGGHLGEVGFDEPFLEEDSTADHLGAAGPELGEGAGGEDRQCLHPGRVGGAPRGVWLAGGDHRGDAAVQVALEEVERALARGEVADDGMHVGVDEPRHHGGAGDVDDPFDVAVDGRADRVDLSVPDDDRVGVGQRPVDVSGDEGSDVGEREITHRRPSSPLISSTVSPPTRGCGRPPSVTATAMTISSGAGASTMRSSMASKWLRTKAASLWWRGTSIGVPGAPLFFEEGMMAFPPPQASRRGAPKLGWRMAATCSSSPAIPTMPALP